MNKITLLLIPLVLLATACAASPVKAESSPQDLEACVTTNTEAELLDCLICDMDETYDGPLSLQEVAGLLKALNDEYHAWAVYEQVVQDFGQVKPFGNIQRSEEKHIAALLRLFDKYDVSVPENVWIDNVPSFDSVQDACAAGVDAEIANVALYNEIFSTTDRDDILTVYAALQSASQESHLPAFQRCAK
ncbi:MAG: DUF2202 domain-containing protein [Anaerolineae bacterium]|jgi:hypothetical protein